MSSNLMTWTDQTPSRFRMPAYGAFGAVTCPALGEGLGENSALVHDAVIVMDFPGTPAWRPPDW